jgi:hypothetical protein
MPYKKANLNTDKETSMKSSIKKYLYIPWVLFLFGIAAILTLLELLFRKGRSMSAFNGGV